MTLIYALQKEDGAFVEWGDGTPRIESDPEWLEYYRKKYRAKIVEVEIVISTPKRAAAKSALTKGKTMAKAKVKAPKVVAKKKAAKKKSAKGMC